MRIRCPKCSAVVEVDASSGEGQAACSACGAALRVRAKAKEPSRCPMCLEPVAPGAVICVNCGLNLKDGGRLRTATDLDDPPPREEEAPPSAPMRAIQLLAEYVPGVFRPVLLVASIVGAIAGLGILVFGLALFALAPISAFAVAAAGVIVYAHAMGWLLDGHFGFLSEALVDFDNRRWGIFAVLMVVPLLSLWLLTKTLLAP